MRGLEGRGEYKGAERSREGWMEGWSREGERGRVEALMGHPLSFFICGFTTQ